VARVLRELDEAGLQDSFTVIGTQALYAYEAAGGAHFLLELLASGDVDLLYDTSLQWSNITTRWLFGTHYPREIKRLSMLALNNLQWGVMPGLLVLLLGP